MLYSQITPTTADLTALDFGTRDIDAFGFLLTRRVVAFWAANGGPAPFKLTLETTNVLILRNGATVTSGDGILSLLMGPADGELLPSPDHTALINTGGTPVALEAGIKFLKTPEELGLAEGDSITFTALFKAKVLIPIELLAAVTIRDSDDANYSDKLSDMATILILGAPVLPADKAYEGWFVSDDGVRKESTGILALDADGIIPRISQIRLN